jgi:hypothetical protein
MNAKVSEKRKFKPDIGHSVRRTVKAKGTVTISCMETHREPLRGQYFRGMDLVLNISLRNSGDDDDDDIIIIIIIVYVTFQRFLLRLQCSIKC